MMISKMRLVLLSFTALLAIGLSSCLGNGDTKREHTEKGNATGDTALGTIIANMQSQLPINCGGGLFLNVIEQREDGFAALLCLDALQTQGRAKGGRGESAHVLPQGNELQQ